MCMCVHVCVCACVHVYVCVCTYYMCMHTPSFPNLFISNLTNVAVKYEIYDGEVLY